MHVTHELAVIVPTRERPHVITDVIKCFNETTYHDRADVALCLVVDDDDPTLPEYTAVVDNFFSAQLLTVPPGLHMIGALNYVATAMAALNYAKIIGFMGDDHRPRTWAWDRRIVWALTESPGVAYGNDLLQGATLATAVFITSDVIRRLGYMAPVGLWHLYADNYWIELGRETNLTYLDDVIIEHVHPAAGKAEMDDRYRAVNAAGIYEHDRTELERYMRDDWHIERLKLK